jgi:hypothetical protein
MGSLPVTMQQVVHVQWAPPLPRALPPLSQQRPTTSKDFKFQIPDLSECSDRLQR